jgi:glycerol-3-phosphate acyltransferase PlsY
MEGIIADISKQFLIVAVAIWILTSAIYKIQGLEKHIKKELMATIIGIAVTIIGYFTGYFTGHLIALISTMLIAIFISQEAYDKTKNIFNQQGQ